MKERIRSLVVLILFAIVSACGQSTPVPMATSVPTDTPSPTETLLPAPTLTSTPTEVPREPTGPQAGTTLLYNDGSTLVFIPAGTFEMGGGGKDNPVHTVSLGSYWIQKTEVTRRMYAMCLTDGSCSPAIEVGVGGFVLTDTAYFDDPVVGLKNEQARSYCMWMGGRLPTEAEWEYAARGIYGGSYPWGNDEPTCDLANLDNCVGGVTRVTNYQADKSPFGILGMGGNVREWVNDYFDGNYYTDSPSQNPMGPIKGNYYVVRGGAYASPAEEATTYFRGFLKSAGYKGDVGFRCVVDNPSIYAPYCEASQYTQEVQSIRPGERCEPSVSQLSWDRKFVLANKCEILGTVTGGKLISIAPVNPMFLKCEETDAQNFECTPSKLAAYSGPAVIACVSCSTGSSADTPPLECPVNYAIIDGKGYCEYVGGPVPGYCPPNSILLNENQCVYQQVQAGSCPIGSYFDEGMKACVTLGQSPRECIDGFNYDIDKACCVEGISMKYPLCRHDEYFSSEYGCVPLPNPAGVESCTTSYVYPCQ